MSGKQDIEKRFWGKVNKTEECWEWCDYEYTTGYGMFYITKNGTGKLYRAHRVSWELHNGKIPKGIFVLHKCDNRLCVRPGHLFLGTNQDNMDDMVSKGRSNKPKGEEQGLNKLTDEQVLEIRALYIPYKVSTYKLAKKFGVSHTTIHKIILRKAWMHI